MEKKIGETLEALAKVTNSAIPAKAGIQNYLKSRIPGRGSPGMTTSPSGSFARTSLINDFS